MEAEISSTTAGLTQEGQLLVLVLDVNTEQVGGLSAIVACCEAKCLEVLT